MRFSSLLASCCLIVAIPAAAQGLLDKAREASAPQTQARQGLVRAGQLQAALVAQDAAAAPGRPFRVGLRIIHDPHWHTYWRNPGDSGLPTRVTWALPAGWTAGPMQWPTPRRIAVGPLANYGYEGDVLLPMTITPPAGVAAGEVMLQARASWLVCKDVCIPGDADLAIMVRVSTRDDALLPSADAVLFAAADARIPADIPARMPQAFIHDGRLALSWNDEASADDPGPGLFMPYIEGLVLPAAAQSVARTAKGWRVDIPLGESSSAAVAEVRRQRFVEGIWVVGDRPGIVWRAGVVTGSPPESVAMVHPGVTAAQEAAHAPAREVGALGLWGALAAAFVGGLILNLMPCVFPVIGLKVLSFAQSGTSVSAAWRQSLWFSTGVVASFVALAALLIILRSAGEAVGWGFQLQNAWVVLGLALLFVLIGLNLFGVFEMGGTVAQLGNLPLAQRVAHREGIGAAFGSGVLAVIVASPCTAPFMGGAIGFTASAGVMATLAVFAALGLGMSCPYIVLALSPGLLRRLPRPGPWMVRFRQVMAFPMLAAAAWLIWVLATLQGVDAVLPALLAAIALALALWIYGGQIQVRRAGLLAWVVMVAALLAVATAFWAAASSTIASGALPAAGTGSSASMTTASGATGQSGSTPVQGGELQWQTWAPGLAERVAASGSTVFVDFTASWCITCQANKVRVLQSKAVTEAFRQGGVIALRADWTKGDAAIGAELRRHGRDGVPLYLVFRPGAPTPRILSEWLTEKEVLEAIR